MARTGERSYESELHRLRALCLVALTPPRSEEAHGALRQAAAVAREQGAVLVQRRVAETGPAAARDAQSGSVSQPAPSS